MHCLFEGVLKVVNYLESVLNVMENNFNLVALFLLTTFLVGIIVFIIVIKRLNKLAKQYKTLMRGLEGKNIEDIMLNNAEKLEKVIFTLKIYEDKLKEIEKAQINSLQHVGIQRYNAFNDMGGDLSYSLALLNKNGDGIVLTSIYGRDDARTYAKPIRKGKSSYKLSIEEEQAIRSSVKKE